MNKMDKNEDIEFSKYLEDFGDIEAEDIEEKPAPERVPDASPREDSIGKNKMSTWWKNRTKKQRILIIAVSVLLILIIAICGFIWSKISLIDTDDDFTGSDDIVLDDNIDAAEMDSITDANSLHDYLKKWATNGGEKLSAKYVKNILLVGQDSTSGCTDTMMLVSVNDKTKKISMVSFYRDSWTYVAPKGKRATFAKMNAAYSKGGAKCMIETIENDYKIEIDDYVMVNYDSFPRVVDALGGVDVYVEPREANYLNTTWQNWTRTGKKVSYTSGVNHLNGEKALMFCRIRGLDSDINRTERQRSVITSIMNSFKDASITQLNSAANALLPNIKTGLSKTQILSLVADGFSRGWLKYEINQATMPTEDTSKGGFVGKTWVWLVDYEGAAYQLQMLLYGQSNIKLSDDRVSPIKLKPTTNADNYAYPTKKHSTGTLTTRKYPQEDPSSPVEPTSNGQIEVTTEPGNNIEESTTAAEEATTTEQTTSPSENETTNPIKDRLEELSSQLSGYRK